MTSTVRRNLFLYRTLVEEFENPSCYPATGILVSPPAEPAGLARLYAAVPNPFNPRTMIRFELARGARARLRIFAVDGSLVRTIIDRVYPAGEHRVYWDGQNDRGRDVGSGAYFVSLEADGIVTRKDYKEVPPRVEYALTSFGGTLCDALAPLCAWGQLHMERIEACQQEHEAKRQKASG